MFTVRHPLQVKIDTARDVIQVMTGDFPAAYKDWCERMSDELRRKAEEDGEGDPDITHDIYMNYLRSFDCYAVSPSPFYKAMLLTACGYYERSLRELGLDEKYPQRKVLEKYGNLLASDTQLTVRFLLDTIYPVRNFIAHQHVDLNAETKQKNAIDKIQELYEGVSFANNELTFEQPQMVYDVLDKMHHVLTELAKGLGYKSRLIGKPNS